MGTVLYIRMLWSSDAEDQANLEQLKYAYLVVIPVLSGILCFTEPSNSEIVDTYRFILWTLTLYGLYCLVVEYHRVNGLQHDITRYKVSQQKVKEGIGFKFKDHVKAIW